MFLMFTSQPPTRTERGWAILVYNIWWWCVRYIITRIMTITACECTTTYIYIYTLLWVDDVLLYIIASVFEPESYHLIQVMPTFMFWSTAPPPRQRRFEIHGPRRSRKWQRGLEATWRRETWREGWVWDARDPRVCIYIYICSPPPMIHPNDGPSLLQSVWAQVQTIFMSNKLN